MSLKPAWTRYFIPEWAQLQSEICLRETATGGSKDGLF